MFPTNLYTNRKLVVTTSSVTGTLEHLHRNEAFEHRLPIGLVSWPFIENKDVC